MKRRILSLLALLLVAVLLCVPVCAVGFEAAQLDFVTDAAGLLTDQQWAELEEQAKNISQRYQCGVYIILLDDFTEYTHDDTIYEAAKTIYKAYDLGYGTERSGELLMLSMAERDYTLIAYGYGNTAFTDYGKDKLADAFLDDFGDDDWYSGLSDYLEKSESMLRAARGGKPVDVDSNPLIVIVGTAIALVVGCGLAMLLCWKLEQVQMRSVAAKTEADAYLRAGSLEITNRQDLFTHTTRVRTKIESSSGGGGGTSVGSSGFSGKSGKF